MSINRQTKEVNMVGRFILNIDPMERTPSPEHAAAGEMVLQWKS